MSNTATIANEGPRTFCFIKICVAVQYASAVVTMSENSVNNINWLKFIYRSQKHQQEQNHYCTKQKQAMNWGKQSIKLTFI